METELIEPELVSYRSCKYAISDAGNYGSAVGEDATLISRIAYGHALLVEIYGEFEGFCNNLTAAQCNGCAKGHDCEGRFNDLFSRFINTAAAHVNNERELIDQHRMNPKFTRALEAHLLSHELLINDLNSYLMDCGRVPIADLVYAASCILKYWIECHMSAHDKLLLDIVSGATSAS